MLLLYCFFCYYYCLCCCFVLLILCCGCCPIMYPNSNVFSSQLLFLKNNFGGKTTFSHGNIDRIEYLFSTISLSFKNNIYSTNTLALQQFSFSRLIIYFLKSNVDSTNTFAQSRILHNILVLNNLALYPPSRFLKKNVLIIVQIHGTNMVYLE